MRTTASERRSRMVEMVALATGVTPIVALRRWRPRCVNSAS